MDKKINKAVILLIDFITINLAWLTFFYFRVESGLFQLITSPEMYISMIVVYIYWLLVFFFVGMYRTWFALSRFDEISVLLKSTFFGVLILFSIIFFDDFTHGVQSSNRYLIFIYWGFIFIYVSAGRILVRSIQRNLLIRGIGRRNAIIVGFNKKSMEVADEILNHRGLGLDILGFIEVSEDNLEKEYKGFRVLGKVDRITDIISNKEIREVIIGLEHHDEDILVEIISKCENRDVGIKIVPDLYDILSGQAKTMQLYGLPLIDINPQLMPEWEKKIKRLLDIIIAFIAIIFSLPLIILVGIAIKIDSNGPVFYRQERTGKDGKTFKIFKFRSMVVDAEKNTGPIWSKKDDPRVTRVGKIVRKVRIDEIPQMINVLKGDMSLVGPRPERPFFVEKLAKEIPYYKRRLKVKPGVTGWAQIKHKYDESVEDVREKLKYDLFYIENMSLRMDFKILFRTVFVVFFGKGHYD
ncbi:MAG: undecaprenyl-phosphate glucose phosphotransferase [Ignavibacteriales bacterium]|jgi:exopolysaccharide biosynthesis polyprenyl glycosylphosphotransferase|nr:undecaprenyl-phosphate glucose phosphotransferase [Ignavibacteriaceae bacterium]NLH60985.1 undecaprenyl-phosphate glucose phosphotransferase [Ignavibacteriales bacterium]